MQHHRWIGSVATFVDWCRPATIDTFVEELSRKGRPPGGWKREAASWSNSLPQLAEVLERADLPQLSVLLEYNPHGFGNGRVDVILGGFGAGGERVYVVMELKQWSGGVFDPVDDQVRETGARYEQDGLKHPLHQARDYAMAIRNYTDGMHDEDAVHIHPVAYLHNATTESVRTLLADEWEDERRLYTGDTEQDLIVALKSWFAAEAEHAAAGDALKQAGYRQGPALLEAAAEILTDPARFPMTVEQGEIHAAILRATHGVLDPASDKPRAIIGIEGGPGTGKTWIAMHLVGALARAERQVSYATNSTSLAKSLRERAKRLGKAVDLPVAGLVTSSRTYWSKDRWATPLDVLIVDEGHRIEKHTIRTGFGNAPEVQAEIEANEQTQLFELAKSARVLVVLIDEAQSVMPASDCTVAHLHAMAERTGASLHMFELTEQHRSGGSAAYEAWVDALVAGQAVPWKDEERFSVRVSDSPEEFEAYVFDPSARGADEGARLLAGFAWEYQPWPKTEVRSIDDVPFDITIGTWEKRWNLRHPIDGYPQASDWASNPTGAEQVGSMFTAQGFEFGRCGVLIGDDFRWDPTAQEWVVDVSKTHWVKYGTEAKKDPARVEQLIRNQYRVLLTRAMAATAVYSPDPATRQKLAELVNP